MNSFTVGCFDTAASPFRERTPVDRRASKRAPKYVPKRRKTSRCRLPRPLHAGEMDQLLSACRAEIGKAVTPCKRRAARRDLLMVMSCFYLAVRVSELCRMRIEHVDLRGGSIEVREGKGRRDRVLPISARLRPELQQWLQDELRGAKSGWLFISCLGKRISPRTFQERLERLGRLADIPRRLHPHMLRHTAASACLELGATIKEVQELLGHAWLSSTEKYLHVNPERLRQAVDRL